MKKKKWIGVSLALTLSLPVLITSVNADELVEQNSSELSEVDLESYEDSIELSTIDEDAFELEEVPEEEILFEMEGYASSSLYIRPEPNSTESLGILPKNTKVSGKSDGIWLEFDYEGQKAYVAAAYFSEEASLDLVSGYLTAPLYVRPEPNSSESLGIVEASTYIDGTQINPYWIEFTYQGQKAYIASGFLTDNEIVNAITTSSLYVRPQPGSSDHLGIVPKYYHVENAEISGSWAKFNYENQEAYIASDFLTEQIPQREGPAVSGYVSSSLYVRPVPASKGSLGIIDKHSKVEGRIVNDYWVRFSFNGKTAYIAAAFLQEGEIVDGYTESDLYVRPEPNSSKSLGILPKYSRIEDAPSTGAWVKVQFKGQEGYIAKNFIANQWNPNWSREKTLENVTGVSFDGNRIVSLAKRHLGTPYRYAGRRPGGFDCSGIVTYVYQQWMQEAGIRPSSIGLLNAGHMNVSFWEDYLIRKGVDRSPLMRGYQNLPNPQDYKPGDLVICYSNSGGTNRTHMGIYVGNNQVLHSTVSRGLIIEPLYKLRWTPTYRVYRIMN